MHSKKLIIFMLTLCMVVTCAGYALAAGFSDLSGHWAREQIEKWAENGLAGGYRDGTFKPDNEISRAEFVAMVNRAFVIDRSSTAAGFADVNPGKWYYEDVISARAAGYIGGYAGGTFKPDQTITRQEVASIITRLLQINPSTDGLAEFSDAGRIQEWARGSVGAVAGAGLMRGMPDNTFRPTKSITRAEAVVSLDRALAYATGEHEPEAVAGAVEGVVTLDGKMRGNVTVRIFAAGSYEVLAEVKTDQKGYFKAELDAGYYDITAATGSEVAYKSDIHVTENKVAEINLALEDAAVVKGILKDKNDRPVKNTKVLFTTNPTFIATTNNNGEYTVALLAGRTYTVRTYEPGEEDKEPVIIAEKREVGTAGVQSIGVLNAAFSVSSPNSGGSGGGGGSTTRNITMDVISDVSIISETTSQKTITTNPAGAVIKAVSSSEQTAGITVSGNIITITAKQAGSATITVTAEKSGYENAVREFTVTVIEKEQPIPLDNPVAITEEVKTLVFENNVSLDFSEVAIPANAAVAVAEMDDDEVPAVPEGALKTAGKVVKIELQGNVDLSKGVELALPFEGNPDEVGIFYYDDGEWKYVDSTVDAVNKVVKATVYHFSTWAPFEAAQVAKPAASPAPGTLEKGSTVELTTGTEGATIYYTTDGTAPTINSSKYANPIAVNDSVTIKAVAVKGNMRNSEPAAFEYTVSNIPVTGIVLSLIKMELEAGKTLKLDATVDPGNATNKNVTWSSSDENVATVDGTGLVTGVGVGTATVTATTADGGFTATCAVTVVAASSTTPAELEVNPATSEQGIRVSVLNPANDEYLIGLQKADFLLADVYGNAVEFNFNDPAVRDSDIPGHEYLLSPVEGEFSGTYTLTFTKAGYQQCSEVISIGAPFTPGEGGTLPAFTPFTPQQGKIGGLYVDRNHRWVTIFSGNRSYYPVVDLKFPAPSKYDAESYTLQYSTDGTSWSNYQYYGDDVTTTGDNFSLSSPGGDYQYRLLVNGGPENGSTSNAVYAPLSCVNTYFSGWGLDESMSISGTMVPWVGRGLEASFTVQSLEDASVVDDVYLDYQWYRVNPVTYDMEPIAGATGLTYITTDDDAGYHLLIRATGDGENIGGFAQIITGESVLPNKAFASDITDSGFTLNLYRSVDDLTSSDLVLRDCYGSPVAISAVNPVGDSKAIFAVEADMPPANGPFRLENKSYFWRLAEEFEQGYMVHEGLTIGSDSNYDF